MRFFVFLGKILLIEFIYFFENFNSFTNNILFSQSRQGHMVVLFLFFFLFFRCSRQRAGLDDTILKKIISFVGVSRFLGFDVLVFPCFRLSSCFWVWFGGEGAGAMGSMWGCKRNVSRIGLRST